MTGLPETGTTVKRGGTLLRVDDRPVVLLYGSLPMYRDLGLTTTASGGGTASGGDTVPGGGTGSGGDTASGEGKTDGGAGGGGGAASPSAQPAPTGTGNAAVTELKGMDVLQFETNLAALGYTGFTVDETFTRKTADAVERWQKSLGIPETGRVGIGDVIYSAGEVRIGRPGVRLGEAVTGNALTYTGTTRKVVVDASAADASWAVRGAAVRVRLPDGRTVEGEVASVGRQASAPEGGFGEDGSGQGGATVPVTVTIEEQKSVGRLESGPVTVEYVVVEAEDPLDDLRPGEDPARLPGQRLQDGELLGGQRDGLPRHPHLEARGVQHHRTDPQHRGLRRAGGLPRPAQQRPYPRGQLTRAVGLGEVVVGAQVETEEHVLLGGAGGEEENGNIRLGPQDAAHVEPVDQRQHHIEHDEIGFRRAGLLQRRPAVPHDLHRVAFPLQVDPDQPGLLLVVLGHQNPSAHRFSPSKIHRSLER